MAATPPAQPCVVCCMASKTRCSPCAKVGVELFFCSPECQRLVWRAHKPVCARNPFPLPDVTPDEAAAFAASAHTPLVFAGKTTTEAERLSMVSGLPADIAMQRLAGPACDPTFPFKAMLVLNMRVSRITAPRASDQPSAMDLLNPYALLPLSNLFVDELLPKDLGPQKWFVELLHRSLIVSALIARQGPAADPHDPRARLGFVSLSVFQNWLRCGMGTGDADFVESLKDNDFFQTAEHTATEAGAAGK
ncbi:hypothetical protein JCM3770_004195 [Rhodotorula araucariae]